MIADLTKEEKTENLEDKRRLLELLRKRMDFADIQKAYDNWRFSDLVGDNDFKRMYEDQAVKEREKPDSEYFEENIGKYIKLVEEGKEITSRYFGKWKVNFQAYCEEINNNRVLNVNLIHYDKSEPTRISDILQQEKDIKELNIYCNKKHEIYAHQEGKKRYYEIKEGACYGMISTWPVENGSRMCTMIMNLSSDGITEVLKFDGEDFVSSEEILELIKQNDELYIQDLFLYDAVMKSLEKGKAADVVPTANNNFQNESIAAYQDKEPGGNRKVQTLKLMMTIAFILLLLLIAMHQLKQKLIYNRLQLRQKLIHNKPKLKRKSIYNRLQLRQKLLHNILESKQKLTHNKQPIYKTSLEELSKQL